MSAPLRRKRQDIPRQQLNYLNVLSLSQKLWRMQALPALLKPLFTGVATKEALGKVRNQNRPFVKLTVQKALSSQKPDWLPGNGLQDGQAGTGSLGCFLDLSFSFPTR